MREAIDLERASRETLLAVIAEQQAMIATLEQRVADLKRRLRSSGGQGMAGIKAKQRSPIGGACMLPRLNSRSQPTSAEV